MRPLLLLLVILGTTSAADLAALKARGLTLTEKAGVVTGVSGEAKGLTVDDWRTIAGLTSLTTLRINRASSLTDETLALLAPLVNLQEMSLEGSDFSDDGCKHFVPFTKLKSLALFHPSRNRAEFTGAGLAHLAVLPVFERLTVAGANVGDAAFIAVGKLPHLVEFRQWHNLETAAALSHLTGMPKLRRLMIGQRLVSRTRGKEPSFTDATIDLIVQLTGLEELTLTEARLSGDALIKLKALPKLKKLSVSQVDTLAADIEKVKTALANVTIAWKPLTEEQGKMLTDKLKL